MKLSGVLTWLLLIAIFISGPAAGFDIDRLELRHLGKEAEFVFIGTVEAIDYRTSSVTSEDEVALPHTFVTFKIQEVLKGKAANKSITLRFQGGRIKTPDGEYEYLIPSLIPLFDIGDRDILFVKGNGKSICPLVGLRQGRFRLIGDHVYTDLGRPVGFSASPLRSLPFLRNDIIRPLELFDRLLNPRTSVDRKIASRLSKAAHASIRAAIKAAPYSAPVLRAKHLLVHDLNEISGMDAMASSPRAKGTREAIVKPLVSEKEMTSVRLRGQTRGLLQKPPKALSASETALLNRLLLEDLYHPHLVRRLDKGLVRFPFIASETPSAVLKAVMGHEALCVDCRFELKRIDSGAGNPDGVAQALNKATMTKSTAEAFLKHLRASIPALHTEDELKALTPVASVKIDEPFYVKAAKPVRPVLDLILSRAAVEGQTGLEAAEEEAMIKSGFNPVLKPPRVE